MSTLKSHDIKEYLRAQIRNCDTNVNCFLTDIEDYYHDPVKVLEKAQAAVTYRERKVALECVLTWIKDMETRLSGD